MMQRQKFLNLICYLNVLNYCFCWNPYLAPGSLLEETIEKRNYKQETKVIFNYIGCYRDKRESRDINERDFSYITKFNKSIPTVEICVQLCSKEAFKFAGVQAL